MQRISKNFHLLRYITTYYTKVALPVTSQRLIQNQFHYE
jgi:transcriptional regulator of heat shock response